MIVTSKMGARMKPELKQKKCKVCSELFDQYQSTHVVCSPRCALDLAREKAAKRKSKETRAMRKEFNEKDRSYQLKKAQEAFNAFIRYRDRADGCISSGRTTGQRHAGHFLSIGSCPELRFEETNCHIQSMKDNSWLSGNQSEYRINLIKKIGLRQVEWLEGPHPSKNYTLDDIIAIKIEYRRKLKLLQSPD